jgi:hypothetical protein
MASSSPGEIIYYDASNVRITFQIPLQASLSQAKALYSCLLHFVRVNKVISDETMRIHEISDQNAAESPVLLQ